MKTAHTGQARIGAGALLQSPLEHMGISMILLRLRCCCCCCCCCTAVHSSDQLRLCLPAARLCGHVRTFFTPCSCCVSSGASSLKSLAERRGAAGLGSRKITNDSDENRHLDVKWRIVLIATVVSLSHPITDGEPSC
ncbi:hypothetical protein AOLI_G00102380 [Acnodon oligacanthus]